MDRRSRYLQLAMLVAGAVAAYAVRLDYSPASLHDAEIQFGLHARSIALTAHDTNGRFLPVYFQMPAIGGNVWFHPFLVYWVAPWFWVLPFSEYTTRLPSVAIGAIDIVLTYALVWKLCGRHSLALAGAAFIALMPAHFIHSRLAMDYLYPVPFILAWMWCLVDFLQNRREPSLVAGSLVLGVGVYSYIASVAMMPIYVVATLVFLALARQLTVRRFAEVIVLFLVPLLIAAFWLGRHSAVVAETIGRYSRGTASLNMFGRIREFLNYNFVQELISVYSDYFNPTYVFLSGGSNPMNSTRLAGVFLLPFAVFLLEGIRSAWATRWTPVSFLMLFGFFTAPLAAALVGERYAVDRQLGILPFAAVLGVYGLDSLQHSRGRFVKAMIPVLLIAMLGQFFYFYYDYMTDYRVRSVGAFNYNVRGAAEELIARATPARTFFFSRSIPYARQYWQFALAKTGMESLDRRTQLFDPATVDVGQFPPGSLIAAHVADTALKTASEQGKLELVTTVPELGGTSLFVIYERP